MVVAPDLEEISDGNTSPSLLGWIDIADIMRAFLTCELVLWRGRGEGWGALVAGAGGGEREPGAGGPGGEALTAQRGMGRAAAGPVRL